MPSYRSWFRRVTLAKYGNWPDHVHSILVLMIWKKNCTRLSFAAGCAAHCDGITDVKPLFWSCRNFCPSGPAHHFTYSQAASLFLLAAGMPAWMAQPLV